MVAQAAIETCNEEPYMKANKVVGGDYSLAGTIAELKLVKNVLFKPQLFDGPMTFEVLGVSHPNDPRTVYDRLRADPRAFNSYLHRRATYFMEPEVEMDTLWLREWRALVYRYTNFASLPLILPNSYHVYIVTSTDISWRDIWLHRNHWSLYTQGCFFHLGVVHNSDPRPESSAPRGKLAGAELKLQLEIFSEQTPTGFETTGLNPPNKAFVALESGLTQYTMEETRRLAENLIERMNRYAIRGANCHNFVAMLMVRLLMGKRDYSVFVGTKNQIVDWDLKRYIESATHADGLDTGFLVRKPMLQRFRIPPIFNPAHQLTIQRINRTGKLYKARQEKSTQ